MNTPLMKIYLIIIYLFLFNSCNKNIKNEINSEKIVLDEKSTEGRTNENYDIAVSTWYIYQYSAIEELERVTLLSVNVGNKVTDSPKSILKKQKDLAIIFAKKHNSDKSLISWSDHQKFCAEKLFLSVGEKIKMHSTNLSPLAKAAYYIDIQNELLTEIGYN